VEKDTDPEMILQLSVQLFPKSRRMKVRKGKA
jgi:hypothetical protein